MILQSYKVQIIPSYPAEVFALGGPDNAGMYGSNVDHEIDNRSVGDVIAAVITQIPQLLQQWQI